MRKHGRLIFYLSLYEIHILCISLSECELEDNITSDLKNKKKAYHPKTQVRIFLTFQDAKLLSHKMINFCNINLKIWNICFLHVIKQASPQEDFHVHHMGQF